VQVCSALCRLSLRVLMESRAASVLQAASQFCPRGKWLYINGTVHRPAKALRYARAADGAADGATEPMAALFARRAVVLDVGAGVDRGKRWERSKVVVVAVRLPFDMESAIAASVHAWTVPMVR
jgi:hypothetical protein